MSSRSVWVFSEDSSFFPDLQTRVMLTGDSTLTTGRWVCESKWIFEDPCEPRRINSTDDIWKDAFQLQQTADRTGHRITACGCRAELPARKVYPNSNCPLHSTSLSSYTRQRRAQTARAITFQGPSHFSTNPLQCNFLPISAPPQTLRDRP